MKRYVPPRSENIMKSSRRVSQVIAAPLDRFGDWLNAKLLLARDEFNILIREMDERSIRDRA